MKYIYHFDYDHKNDEFIGLIMDEKGNTAYEINDTEEILTLIEGGFMEHIDDTQGLEKILRTDNVMDKNDSLEFGGILK